MSPLNLKDSRIVLLLQGGGALGAYQVGAHRALAERCRVDWVAGISIGAINASVIAGHKGDDASSELESLWNDLLSPQIPPFDDALWSGILHGWPPSFTRLQTLLPKYASWTWTAFSPAGQPGFFSSRVLDPAGNPWFLQWLRPLYRDELSFYDTTPLRITLDSHVRWSKLDGNGPVRLSVGAARVRDGEVVFFDSHDGPLAAEHVMASGALPPAFPPVCVEGEWYFDGGVSNNTPIEVLEDKLIADTDQNTVVFLIDLWDRKNNVMPRTFDELVWRQKAIQYGSRKKAAETVIRNFEHHSSFNGASHPRLDVVQVMLENPDGDPQFAFSDADFSRSTFNKLRAQGYRDMNRAIDCPERVGALGGDSAALYRYGSEGKHWNTDRLLK
jgi:NTE family protein